MTCIKHNNYLIKEEQFKLILYFANKQKSGRIAQNFTNLIKWKHCLNFFKQKSLYIWISHQSQTEIMKHVISGHTRFQAKPNTT